LLAALLAAPPAAPSLTLPRLAGEGKKIRLAGAGKKIHLAGAGKNFRLAGERKKIRRAANERLRLYFVSQTRSITIAMPWPTPMHIVHSA
jgi:hypothetical protein